MNLMIRELAEVVLLLVAVVFTFYFIKKINGLEI